MDAYAALLMNFRPGLAASLGLDPPTYLEIGQSMHLGITGLGEQRQRIIAAP